MATAAEVVASTFAQAQTYANSAQAALTGFTSALDAAIYAPPTVSVTWNSLTAPSLPSLPAQPALPTIEFNAPAVPTALSLDEPTIEFDEFTETAPTTTFPTAPTLSYGTAPTVPAVADVAVPSAPTITLPDAPTYMALSTPTFGGIDLHEDWLTKLEDIPTLTLVEPTPYTYSSGPQYASALLTDLKATLLDRLSGGTGLPDAVEQAIWDRARSRETQLGLANEAEIMRASEAMGFQLPSGVLAAQLRNAQQDSIDKQSTLSRDVMVKQSELEQENMKQTIDAGMRLEGQLIDYSYKLESLTFESAKFTAENAIAIYNAMIEQYKALLQAYQTYASAYKTIIDAELSKVEVFKAEIAAEQAKADFNKALVAQYQAEVDVRMSYVKIFEAQVGAAKVLVEIEQAKIGAAGEQIRAYTAQVNAETAKIEAYKAGVQAEGEKVRTYAVKADVFKTKVGAQAEQARLNISFYEALTRTKSLEWDGYRAKSEAESNRMRALAAQSGSLLDGYKAAMAAVIASAETTTKVWETQIKQYEAAQQVTLNGAKINGDFAIATNNARLDASKVGAQVYAQLTASAYSMMRTGASVSASAGTSVGYNYSNKTTSAAPMLPSI